MTIRSCINFLHKITEPKGQGVLLFEFNGAIATLNSILKDRTVIEGCHYVTFKKKFIPTLYSSLS